MSDRPRPIVDLSGKPSRWRRFVAWCWSTFEPGEPYVARPCTNDLTRCLHQVLVAIIVVALIIAWVFWPRHG